METLEALFIVIIILAQFYLVFLAYQKNQIFKNLIPSFIFKQKKVEVIRKKIPTNFYKEFYENPELYIDQVNSGKLNLFQNISKREFNDLVDKKTVDYLIKHDDLTEHEVKKNMAKEIEDFGFFYHSNYSEVTFLSIKPTEENNFFVEKIISPINLYLFKNKSQVTEFNLVKDIIDRESETAENEINLLAPVPLYLGLVGTMLGVIFGLYGTDDWGNVDNISDGIESLIGGVKLAMIASLNGLLLTVVLSSIIIRFAKSTHERSKNEFFNFLQINLIPQLSENINSSIIDLNRTFSSFTSDFNKDIFELKEIIGTNSSNISSQERLVEQVRKLNISKVTSLNIELYDKLTSAANNISEFVSSIQSINGFVRNSEELLKTAQDVSNISQKISENIEKSTRLFEYLDDNYSTINQSGKQYSENLERFIEKTDSALGAIVESGKVTLSNANGEIISHINKTYGELKTSIEQQRGVIQQMLLESGEIIKNEASNSGKSFSYLSELPSIRKGIDDNAKLLEANAEILKQIKYFNSKLDNLNSLTEKYSKPIYLRLSDFILGIFKKK